MFKSGCFFLPTDGKSTELLLSAPEGVCVGKHEEREVDGRGAHSHRAARRQPQAPSVSVDSRPITFIGDWKAGMVTINTFIIQRAQQFINLIQRRNWKIKWMIIKNQAGKGGSLNTRPQPDGCECWNIFHRTRLEM